jgi:hypothetical protein
MTERKTGMTFPNYLRTVIVEPLGLGFLLPVPADSFESALAVPVARRLPSWPTATR